MNTARIQNYPGDGATASQILALAHEYRAAAHHLLELGRPRQPLSRAPFRFAAIQAIELYLNALLMLHGHTSAEIRGLQHDLSARASLIEKYGLRLRVLTYQHIQGLAASREYLITRYGPEITSPSQINRLTATLDEVSSKVTKLF